MELYTLDRGFRRLDPIDTFESLIWNERYSGDGDFKLSVEASTSMMTKLPKGQLVLHEDSDEPMILETRDIKDGLLEATGITLTQWLDNRIIRTTDDHTIKEWLLPDLPPGQLLSKIVQDFCIASSYLDGTINIGLGLDDSHTSLFSIPGLALGAVDMTGPAAISLTVPFGPVYQALKQISETYEVGQKIVLVDASSSSYLLHYISYRGQNRTSDQNVNPVIQFSPEMDSFTNISDLESISDYRNFAYVFATNLPAGTPNAAGYSSSVPFDSVTGFDRRILEVFADDIDPDSYVDVDELQTILNQKAEKELQNHKIVQLVDGEIIEIEDAAYGIDFFLGDIVEVEGNTGVLQKARITEYIRSQDSTGERAYPTLAMID